MIDRSKIASLDIETSGLNSKSPSFFTWAVGVAKFDPQDQNKTTIWEKFYNSGKTEEETRRIFGENTFNADRLANGVFDSYLSNFGNLSGQKSIVKELTSQLSGVNNLVIQNSNFERRVFEELYKISDPAEVKAFSDLFEWKYADSGIAYMGPDPYILDKKNKGQEKISEFLKDQSNTGLFDDATSIYGDIMNKYKDILNRSGGKIQVIEQMDATKGLLLKAAKMGYIDKQYVGIGSSQEFLSKMLLDINEEHLAGSDADQQLRTSMNHIFKMYDELESGNVSAKTEAVLKKISLGMKEGGRSQLKRGLLKAIDDATSQTGYRIYDVPSATTNDVTQKFVDSAGQEVEVTRSFKTSGRATNDVNEAIADTVRRYKGVDIGIDLDRLMSGLADETDIEGKRKLINGLAADNAPFKVARNMKFAMAGIAVGVTLMAMEEDNSKRDIAKIKEKKDINRQLSQSVENNVKMYSKPRISIPNYHGSGFADWNERTGHHEY